VLVIVMNITIKKMITVMNMQMTSQTGFC